MNNHKSNTIDNYFQENYSQIYSLAYRMTENHHDTEEVIQNTFIKCYTNYDKFKNKSKLSTWIYRIIINEGYSYLKSWNKLPVMQITEDKNLSESEFFNTLEFTPSIDDDLIVEEMREKCLFGFLKCVPKKMRVTFLLKNCINLKNSEIAEVLDTSESDVKVSLHRARKKLQEMFEMRCSMVDPDKPCKCYLWIKFMRDTNRPFPSEYKQYRHKELETEHFRNMTSLEKINYMYKTNNRSLEDEVLYKLKKLVKIL